MNRLTEHHVIESGAYMACSGPCDKDEDACGACPELEKIVDRLAAYEDTGLEPEEIKRSDALLRGFIDLSRRHERTLPWIERVMIADREGRLLVLPCKVGDELWITRNGKIQCETVDRITVDQTDEDDDLFISIYTMSVSVLAEDIGRLVFLSREDAEKALEVEE